MPWMFALDHTHYEATLTWINSAVHEMVATMDHIFHTFTRCDTVSGFAGRGKKTAWKTWKAFPEVADASNKLQGMSSEVSEESISLIKRFVVLVYDRASYSIHVNDARKQLFTHRSRTLGNIDLTQEVLKRHIKSASCQVNCWNQALVLDLRVSKSCCELIQRGCKKGCTTGHC